MASSKFSSPFFKKSPLHGAYASGADGMVTVSNSSYFDKLQSDAAGIVGKAYAKDKCDDPNVVQYTENSVLKKCPKKSEDPLTLADIKELNRISDDATIAEEEDNMEDINSTGEFIESLDKKNAAELKQQKTDFANNPSIMNTMKKFKYLT
tara:strand:+ start:524 stop:976 length:453 start_codon:yes stop_codon:yes gene_type:complete